MCASLVLGLTAGCSVGPGDNADFGSGAPTGASAGATSGAADTDARTPGTTDDASADEGEDENTAGSETGLGPSSSGAGESSGAAEGSSGTTDAAGAIDVELVGCAIDFSGEIVVSYNGSLAVGSIVDGGGTLTGSFQFELDGPDVFHLSTQHRIDTGVVVNMVDPGQGTWTNIDTAAAEPTDRIGGTMTVNAWTPEDGLADIALDGVVLVNTSDGTSCQVDGTVTADGLYAGA